ncbi:unnamed protein product [Clavelina lepadiformis]|uniref:Oxidized purine nucleoside triphosphate hydrolase n=1 Tax=Clavelina lepadiformis TaxID=159417 RepID=A0ABP0FMT1_CLALP
MRFTRCTLVQIMKGDEILLGMKKRGLGVGKWNGFGGKLLRGETLQQCSARELEEECGLHVNVDHLTQIGILMFNFIEEDFLLEVNVFKAEQFTGTPMESEEMAPKWFSKENVPYDRMWADDIFWYPMMFSNEMFYGFMEFKGHDNMVSKNLQQVESLIAMESLKQSALKQFSVNCAQATADTMT